MDTAGTGQIQETHSRALNLLRWQVERDASAAQALHDDAMGAMPGEPITDAERVAYVCRYVGIDRARLDSLIAEERAARAKRAA